MQITTEFKEFILRSKVVDLAVGVAVGGAFTKVIESLVKELVMPFFGLFGHSLDFSQLKLILRHADAATKTAEVAINYGVFINSVFTFILVGWIVFLFIKALNRIYKEDKTDQAKITNEILSEMRDLMAKQNGTN